MAPARLARSAFVLLLALAAGGCGGDARPELWIYTSIYPEVIDRLAPDLETAFPEVRFRWHQRGSEQLAGILSAELAGGGTPCDLLLTSDPFYYAELADAGLLLHHETPAAARLPAALADPAGRFATVRIPLMVIAVNRDRLPSERRPRGFADLADPAWRGLVAMGDPLKSGTTFTTVALLVKNLGWELVDRLLANDVLSAGGNSTVLARLETGERPVGIILLENVLPRIASGAPLEVVFPVEGAVPVPSPAAILASTDVPEIAARVYDHLFDAVAQDAIVAGHMYSPLPGHAPPQGAPPLDEVKLLPWDAEVLEWVKARRDEIKTGFRERQRR